MKKKLKSGRGTTIVEMLVALILLALLTAGGIAATSAVMTDYIRMSEAARAELLASTVVEAINNQVRLGRDLSVNADDELELVSANFGADTCIKLDDNGTLVAETGSTKKQLLSDKTYGGLKLDKLKFSSDPAAGGGTGARPVFTVEFQVKSEYGSDPDAYLWSDSVSVASLSR